MPSKPNNFKCAYDKIVPISELKPHPKNPNKHPKDQITRLSQIIEYQGQRSPIVVSNLSGFITKGHGRLEAISKLKWKEVAVDYQDYENEAQEYADIVADNSIALWAELDIPEIQLEAIRLEIDPIMLGIEDIEMPDEEKIDPLTDEDEVPEFVDPITKRGDIWLLGNHRLMCGDSTMIDDVEKLMDGKKADMVFTDPPYGVSYQSNMRTKSEKFDVIKNDEKFITEWINVIPIVSSGWVFVWTSWKVLSNWISFCDPIGKLTNMVIWDKGGGGIGDLEGTFSSDYEVALVYNRGSKLTGKRIGSVWSVGKDKSIDYVHPTQKPVELSTMAISSCVDKNNIVLDLFLGSGSTLIGCEKNNLRCYGMELDEKYCDVIINRWQNYTGKKAKLESNGQPYDN